MSNVVPGRDEEGRFILKAGVRTVRHHKLGWLQEDLLASGALDGSKASLYARLFSDYQAQQIHIRAMKDILGTDYNLLHVVPGRDEEGRFGRDEEMKREEGRK